MCRQSYTKKSSWLWRAGIGSVTTGRPSIRLNPDHDTPVVSGPMADKCEIGDTADDVELLCGMCGDHEGIVGVEGDVDEELTISEEGEQAVRVVLCQFRISRHLVSFGITVSRITRTSVGARIAWKADVESLATHVLRRSRVPLRQSRSTMHSSAMARISRTSLSMRQLQRTP